MTAEWQEELSSQLSSLRADVTLLRPRLLAESHEAWGGEAGRLRETLMRLQVELSESRSESALLASRIERLEAEAKELREAGARQGWISWLFGCCPPRQLSAAATSQTAAV